MFASETAAFCHNFQFELIFLPFAAYLYMLGNTFSGSIPSTIGRMTNLRVLAADFNSLTGILPTEIGLCTLLQELGLSSNDIVSTIPTEIGLLFNLSTCSLPLLSKICLGGRFCL